MTEKIIENQILTYLFYLNGVTAWKNENIGVYDTRKKGFRKRSKFKPKGLPDIIGYIEGTGRALFIEVKKPGGRLTKEQKAFLIEAKNAGCLALVAYDVDDVKKALSFLQ